MRFAQSLFLYSFFLIPLIAFLLILAYRARQRALQGLGDPHLIQSLSCQVNWRGRVWQMVLWILALGSIIFSLARPQWGSEVQAVQQQGIEVMIALDISTSMLAEDFKPNRLSRAKLEIVELLNQLQGDEVGLVLFSGASFILFPLTSDFATARTFLDSAHPDMISRSGTNIAGAIRTALSGFNVNRASQKVVIILTDGEHHEDEGDIGNTMKVPQLAVEQGVIIYTIGFGSPQGEPIPEYNNQGVLVGFKQDNQGQTILSRLDEVTLQQIALDTEGIYYRATARGQEVQALANELDELQKAELESRFETLYIERFQWFLGLGLILLIIIELIPARLQNKPNIIKLTDS